MTKVGGPGEEPGGDAELAVKRQTGSRQQKARADDPKYTRASRH